VIRAAYRPGASWMHRAPPGAKLAALLVIGTGAVWLASIPWLLLLLAVALALFPLTGFRLGEAWRQLRPVLPLLLGLTAAQALVASLDVALATALRFAALLLVSSLLTLTTSPAALTQTLIGVLTPLRSFGIDPERVGLAVSLAIRFLPMVGDIADEVREAQRARGSERSVLRLAVPLIVRILRSADEIADAIDARS